MMTSMFISKKDQERYQNLPAIYEYLFIERFTTITYHTKEGFKKFISGEMRVLKEDYTTFKELLKKAELAALQIEFTYF